MGVPSYVKTLIKKAYMLGTQKQTKNQSETAKECGVQRKTVYNTLQKYPDLDALLAAAEEREERFQGARPLGRKVMARQNALVAIAKCTTYIPELGRTYPTYASVPKMREEYARRHPDKEKPSETTIKRDLKAKGFVCRVRRPRCSRERKNKEARAVFRRSAKRICPTSIIFSDEAWVSIKENTGRFHWVLKGKNALPRERKGRRNYDSFQIWAAVGVGYKSPLVIFPVKRDADGETKYFRLNGKDYTRRCLAKIGKSLERHAEKCRTLGVTYLEKVHKNSKKRVPKKAFPQKLYFQQDNAAAHRASNVSKWFTAKCREEWLFKLADYPSYSPDYNMIELVWKDLHAAIGEKHPTNMEELITAVKEAWDEMPQSKIDAHCLHFANAILKE